MVRAALVAVAVAACGDSLPTGTSTPSGPRRSPVAHAAVPHSVWCPRVPALSARRPVGVKPTGVRSALASRASRRYGLAIVRGCPAVVLVGISTEVIASDLRGDHPLDNLPKRRGTDDAVLLIGVRIGSVLPRAPMFLDGVPVYFYSTGPFRAY